MKLETSSWLQVKEYFTKNNMVIVPIGSIENHGSHMGLGTDYMIPSKLVDLLEERVDILSIPTMPYGMADHHVEFPGTLTIGHDGLHLVISRIAEQLYNMGARKIIFLNGHGGNTPVLTRVALEMNQKGALCAILDWWVIAGQLRPEWKGGHAGAQETSAMLAIDPKSVHMEHAMEFEPQHLSEELPYDGAHNVCCNGVPIPVPRLINNIAESGWFGPDHIRTASVEWGVEMLNEMADFIVDFAQKFERVAL